MTQPTRPTSAQQPAAHRNDLPNASVGQDASRHQSGWWFGLLALLPIACCGLPLLLAAGVTAGSGAVLGGMAGGVLILAGVTILGIWGMRRRARRHAAGAGTSSAPPQDPCC